MSSVRITTTSRREFINVCHILSHAVDLQTDDRMVMDIIGGRNIKKSLAVDAFLLALSHNKGVFCVPASNKMMFEDYPSQADGDIASGLVLSDDKEVSVGFTRNLWDQEDFHRNMPLPSILVIPKKNEHSVSNIVSGLKIHLCDLSAGAQSFHHQWDIEFVSEDLLSRPSVQRFLDRMNKIGERRAARQSLAMTP